MIRTYGGVEKFHKEFYVGAVCPLGFVKINENDKATNFNYYDRKDLQDAVLPFIIKTLKQQLDFGIDTKTCFCLGTGKNYKFLKMVNDEYSFFEEIISLEHPRYIMQYKSKLKEEYIEKYLKVFGEG